MYQFLPSGSWSIVVDEVEGRLELDVVEPGLGRDELMPFAGRNQHQAAGADGKAAGVVLHFAGALFDQIEVLGGDRAGLRRVVDVTR